MTPTDFMKAVVRAYREARESRAPHPKVSRGRSHTVSSTAEDLLARFIAANAPRVDAVLVDQPLSFARGAERRARFYPDLTVVSGGEITAFVDLKMDIGWNRRGLADLCRAHRRTLLAARGKLCRMYDGVTKAARDLRVSGRAAYCVVLASRTNIGGEDLDRQLAAARAFGPEVEVFVLSAKTANQYGRSPKAILGDIGIDHAAFEGLLAKVAAA